MNANRKELIECEVEQLTLRIIDLLKSEDCALALAALAMVYGVTFATLCLERGADVTHELERAMPQLAANIQRLATSMARDLADVTREGAQH